MSWFERTTLLLGNEKYAQLQQSNVLVVGLGGVGAYAAELICRAGVGQMTIVDGDVVEDSNRNRQLPALISNLGKPKIEVLADRLLDINAEIKLTAIKDYLRDEKTIELLDSQHFDYVVDAIDTLSPKCFLIFHAVQKGFRVASSMGAGGKLDPSQVMISDLSKSYNCNLARMVRKRLGRIGVRKGVSVVFSPEEVPDEAMRNEVGTNKITTVGTISYMPPLFGCMLASIVIRGLLENQEAK